MGMKPGIGIMPPLGIGIMPPIGIMALLGVCESSSFVSGIPSMLGTAGTQ
jgi:hypothetical protein